MNEISCIQNLVEKIIKQHPMAVTVSEEGIKNNIIIITIYGVDRQDIPERITQVGEVSVRDIPTQVVIEFTHDGINSLDGILVYAEDSVIANLKNQLNDSKITDKMGIDHLYDVFTEMAEKKAQEELREYLETGCEEVDCALLRGLAEHKTPDSTFSSPDDDSVLEVYQTRGYQYILYTDGGIYEAYKSSSLSPTTVNKIVESNYWY
ncbi:hypothetical protein [Halorubrum depositum]|uniref:hypothetical protein n=1 Tax=Halorubrum depositum TaxID=2583992 RepID=UPI0011A8D219|nr:hypothetical protein [Halorubrum depositum]